MLATEKKNTLILVIIKMAMDNLICPNNALIEQTTRNNKEMPTPTPETALGRNKKMEKISVVTLRALFFILFMVYKYIKETLVFFFTFYISYKDNWDHGALFLHNKSAHHTIVLMF